MSVSIQTVLKIPSDLKLTRGMLAKLSARNFPPSGTNMQIQVDREGYHLGVTKFLMLVTTFQGINMIKPLKCVTAEAPKLS